MNPQLQADIDKLVKELATTYNLNPNMISIFINQALITAKLALLGENTMIGPNDEPISLRETCNLIVEDVAALVSNSVLLHGMDFETARNLYTDIDTKLIPLLQLHLLKAANAGSHLAS